MQCRATLEVIRAYHQIGDAGVRRRVVDLMRSMGHAAYLVFRTAVLDKATAAQQQTLS